MPNLIQIVIAAQDTASAVLKSVSGTLDGVGSTATRLGATMTAAAAPIAGFLGLAVKEAAEAQEGLAQLEAVLKSTGGVAGVTAEKATELANSLSSVTRFSDDAVLSAENMLLTFTSIGKNVFPDATKTVLDMSQALGQDLKSSAIQLGKALNDPIAGVTALSRVGVQFTDAQTEQIKKLVESNDLLGAQTLILKELQREFGGSAEAAGKTFAGRLDILNNKFKNLQESIGTLIIPVLEKLMDKVGAVLDRVIAWTEANPALTRTIVAVAGALVALGPALIGVGSAMKLASTAIDGIGTAIGLLTSPVGLVVAAIAGLVLAFSTNFLGIRDAVQPVFDALSNGAQGLVKAFNHDIPGALDAFRQAGLSDDLATTFTDAFARIGDTVRNFITALPTNLQTVVFTIRYWFGRIWSVIQPALQPLLDWFSGTGPNSLGGAVQSVGTWIDQNVVAPLRGIWILVQPEVQKIVDWFNNDLGSVLQSIGGWINDNIVTPFSNLMAQLQPVFDWIGNLVRSIFKPVTDFVNEALDNLERLRRMGNGTPQRTLPGEVAPGIAGSLGVNSGGSYKPGQDPYADLIRYFTGAIYIFGHSLSKNAAQAALDVQLALDGLGATTDEGAKKFKAAADDASQKLADTGDRLGKSAQRVGSTIASAINAGVSDFAAALSANQWVTIRAIGQVGASIGAALSNLGGGLLVAAAQAVANMRAVGTQIGSAIAGLGGLASGATTASMDLTGTAYANVQVNADRIAAIAAAYKSYYAQSHDYAGSYQANVPYVVSPSAAPEVFIPSSSGYAIPNADLGGQRVTNVDRIEVILPNLRDLSDPRQIEQIASAVLDAIGMPS